MQSNVKQRWIIFIQQDGGMVFHLHHNNLLIFVDESQCLTAYIYMIMNFYLDMTDL